MTNIQYYRNALFTKIPPYEFGNTIAQVRLVNCHRGLKWVSIVDQFNQRLQEIKRLETVQTEVQQATYDLQNKDVYFQSLIQSKFREHTQKSNELFQISKTTIFKLSQEKQFLRNKFNLEEENSLQLLNYDRIKQDIQISSQHEAIQLPLIEARELVCSSQYKNILVISQVLGNNVSQIIVYNLKSGKPLTQHIEQSQKIITLKIYPLMNQEDEFLLLVTSIKDQCTLYKVGPLIEIIFTQQIKQPFKLMLVGSDKQIISLNKDYLLQLLQIKDQGLYSLQDIQLVSDDIRGFSWSQGQQEIIVNYVGRVEKYKLKEKSLELKEQEESQIKPQEKLKQDNQPHFNSKMSHYIEHIDSVLFLDTENQISLYDKQSRTINKTKIPVKIKIEIFLYQEEKDRLVFVDKETNLYHIDKILNHFK